MTTANVVQLGKGAKSLALTARRLLLDLQFCKPAVGVSKLNTRTKHPVGTRARTGQICPESGVWKVDGCPSTTAPIAKGNRMPPYGGKAVTWILIQHA